MEALKVYNKTVSKKALALLISRIKEKKELANLDEEQCIANLRQFFTENPKALRRFDESDEKIERAKEFDDAVKWVRKKVRGVYGLFQTKEVLKAEELLKELEQELKKKRLADTIETHNKLLAIHLSSQERLHIYKEFYEKIFSKTGKPNKIIDIACGYNPFSIPYMGLERVEYVAVELNKNDADLINKYFSTIKNKQITGKAEAIDIAKGWQRLDMKADVCFAFKLFDLIPNKTTENILINMHANWVIASFPTKTVTNLEMRCKRRAGFQKMLRRLKLKYETMTFDNELVYLIRKEG